MKLIGLTGAPAVALLLAGLSVATPAHAQMNGEELQRCIWRCLADSPGAGSSQYNSCVARSCSGQTPSAPSPARATWTVSGAATGGQMASVTVGRSTFSYVCQAGKPALLAISGLPGPSSGVILSVDGREFRPPFAGRDGVHYTSARAGSGLVNALLAGNAVQARNRPGNSVSNFPLGGSGKAIRTAMSRCGIRP